MMNSECFSSVIKFRECQHYPLLSALWLVGDSDAVSLRCVWTRDWINEFFENLSGSSSVVSSCCLLSSHVCYMCTHGHPHISSHGLLKTSSHLAVHSHASPILTRLCFGKPSELLPSFPLNLSSRHLVLQVLYQV